MQWSSHLEEHTGLDTRPSIGQVRSLTHTSKPLIKSLCVSHHDPQLHSDEGVCMARSIESEIEPTRASPGQVDRNIAPLHIRPHRSSHRLHRPPKPPTPHTTPAANVLLSSSQSTPLDRSSTALDCPPPQTHKPASQPAGRPSVTHSVRMAVRSVDGWRPSSASPAEHKHEASAMTPCASALLNSQSSDTLTPR